MPKALLFSCAFLLSLCAQGQRLVITSTTYFGGSSGETVNRAIPTSDGGFLAVGTAFSTDGHFPPPPGGGRYCLVARHDSLGALQWGKRFGGSSTLEWAVCAAQTPDGGFAIGGISSSGNGDVPPRIGNNPGTYDAWVFKLDAAGNLLWSKAYGSSTSDPIEDILPTPDGGLLLLISTGGSDSDAVGGYGGNDWLLIKTDGQGNRQWRRMIGGNDYEGEGKLFNAPGGGYYLAGGSLSHDIDLQEDNLWPGGVPPRYGPVFLRLTDSGQVVWCKRYGGSSPSVLQDALLDLTDTTLVAVGHTRANDFYFTGNHLNAWGSPADDMYIVKVDKDGEIIFSKLLGTNSVDECLAVAKLADGTYVLGGYLHTPSRFGGVDILAFHASASGDSLTIFVGGAASRDEMNGLIATGTRLMAIGLSANPPFINGGTTGPGSNPQGNIFVSQMELWPLSIAPQPGIGQGIALIPNPARSMAECVLPEPATGTLQVVAQDGKVLRSQSFVRRSRLTIMLDGLPAGIYTVVVKSAEGGSDRSARLIVR